MTTGEPMSDGQCRRRPFTHITTAGRITGCKRRTARIPGCEELEGECQNELVAKVSL